MTEIVRASLHGHSDVGSHGKNVHHESDVTIQDKLKRSKEANFIDSTCDHDSTYGLYKLFEEMRYSGEEQTHIAQIEISTPGHIIVSGPMETIKWILKEYRLEEMSMRNKHYIKMKEPEAVTNSILDFLDRFVGGNDKTIGMLPHPEDTLSAGVVGKYPVEEALKIVKSKHIHYLEGFNGMNSEMGNYFNATLAILAKELYGKNIFVGADYHLTKMVGTNINILEAEGSDETSVLKALRNGNVIGFENLVTASLKDIKNWAVNRVRKSEDDMIMKTYNNGWTKDSSFSSIQGKPPLPILIRAAIRYAAKNPESRLWDVLTEMASGVNFLYDRFKMAPKHRKFVGRMTEGYDCVSEPLQYHKFRKDPLGAFESVVAAVAKQTSYSY